MSSSSRFFSAALGFLVVAVVATDGAVAAPFRLTLPPSGAFDQYPTVVAAGTGFQLAWQRYESTGASSIFTQHFEPTGKATAAGRRLAAPKALPGMPQLVPAASGRLGLVWLEPTGLAGTTFPVAGGAFTAPTAIAPLSAAAYDVARLSNGRVALTNVFMDKTTPSNLRVRAAVSLTSPTMAPIVTNQPLFGSDNPYTTPASRDGAVVGDAAGGTLAFYRDRNDGRLYLDKVSAAGVPAKARTQIDTTRMQVGGALEMGNFGVQATRLTNGRYAVIWTSQENADLSIGSLRLRFLDATGKPIGTDQRVNAGTLGTQLSPRLVALPGGRLGIAWIQDEGRTRYHRIRWYGADGKPLGLPRTLRSDTEFFDPAGTQLARLGDGRVVQVWRSYDTNLNRYLIRGEFLVPPK